MKEMTPVAGSTFLVQFHFATLWQSAVLGALKISKCPFKSKNKSEKCFGWNAICRNKFGDFPSVFGSIWHVDYVCYMNKAGIQMYLTLISTQAPT